MSVKQDVVINTGPIISLVAAMGSLDVLQYVFKNVWVPLEVAKEIKKGGSDGFAVKEFLSAVWLKKAEKPLTLLPYLEKSLDLGEASVIQLAFEKKIDMVCIDETAGRRIARLSGIKLTGTIGILIQAQKAGMRFSMKAAIENMQSQGVWLSQTVKSFALKNSIIP